MNEVSPAAISRLTPRPVVSSGPGRWPRPRPASSEKSDRGSVMGRYTHELAFARLQRSDASEMIASMQADGRRMPLFYLHRNRWDQLVTPDAGQRRVRQE